MRYLMILIFLWTALLVAMQTVNAEERHVPGPDTSELNTGLAPQLMYLSDKESVIAPSWVSRSRSTSAPAALWWWSGKPMRVFRLRLENDIERPRSCKNDASWVEFQGACLTTKEYSRARTLDCATVMVWRRLSDDRWSGTMRRVQCRKKRTL